MEFYTFTDNVKEIEGVLESRIRLFTELTLDVINENISHIGCDNGTELELMDIHLIREKLKKGTNLTRKMMFMC